MNRCKSCKCQLDLPGGDDAEKHDQKFTDHCRGCANILHEDREYKTHVARGGRPYEAWLLSENGKRMRRLG